MIAAGSCIRFVILLQLQSSGSTKEQLLLADAIRLLLDLMVAARVARVEEEHMCAQMEF